MFVVKVPMRLSLILKLNICYTYFNLTILYWLYYYLHSVLLCRRLCSNGGLFYIWSCTYTLKMHISHSLRINHYNGQYIMIEHDLLKIGVQFLHTKTVFCNFSIRCVGFNSHLTSKYMSIPIGFYITALK